MKVVNMSKSFTPKEFIEKYNDFLMACSEYPLVKKSLSENPEQQVDLFRLWWIDFREQESIEEAREMDRGW